MGDDEHVNEKEYVAKWTSFHIVSEYNEHNTTSPECLDSPEVELGGMYCKSLEESIGDGVGKLQARSRTRKYQQYLYRARYPNPLPSLLSLFLFLSSPPILPTRTVYIPSLNLPPISLPPPPPIDQGSSPPHHQSTRHPPSSNFPTPHSPTRETALSLQPQCPLPLTPWTNQNAPDSIPLTLHSIRALILESLPLYVCWSLRGWGHDAVDEIKWG